MTPWRWWWLEESGDEYGGWSGDCPSREEVIVQARREFPGPVSFYVMEARSSEAIKYEGADCVPFLRTRNKELLTYGPGDVS